MSLTSYRAAPPRGSGDCVCIDRVLRGFFVFCAFQAWRRPTLPRLETKYHGRWGVSRPSSGWDRVQPPRYGHQAGEGQNGGFFQHRVCFRVWEDVPSARASDAFCAGGEAGAYAIKSDERLVPLGCTHCCASTCGLSTWWSSTALQGDLVLRWVSRLDAFSGYPVRTIATRLRGWRHDRSTRGMSIPVLSY